ncbi:MAG: hypothetical protein IPN57_11870 [Ignavibacteria bacterium]|nr:hypothetical protein [Ignavibacteria bacterium]
MNKMQKLKGIISRGGYSKNHHRKSENSRIFNELYKITNSVGEIEHKNFKILDSLNLGIIENESDIEIKESDIEIKESDIEIMESDIEITEGDIDIMES